MPAVTLTSLLEPARLADLAGMRSYARGATYHSDGRVELGAVGAGRAEAVVRGTMPYDVALWVDMNALRWSCACPVGDDGAFCKHCVAVGLAAVSREPATKRSRRTAASKKTGQEVDLRAYVERLELVVAVNWSAVDLGRGE